MPPMAAANTFPQGNSSCLRTQAPAARPFHLAIGTLLRRAPSQSFTEPPPLFFRPLALRSFCASNFSCELSPTNAPPTHQTNNVPAIFFFACELRLTNKRVSVKSDKCGRGNGSDDQQDNSPVPQPTMLCLRGTVSNETNYQQQQHQQLQQQTRPAQVKTPLSQLRFELLCLRLSGSTCALYCIGPSNFTLGWWAVQIPSSISIDKARREPCW